MAAQGALLGLSGNGESSLRKGRPKMLMSDLIQLDPGQWVPYLTDEAFRPARIWEK